MGIKTIGYLFVLPCFLYIYQESNIDPVLLLVAFVCSMTGSATKAAKDNEVKAIKKSRLISIFASGFVTTIFGYGVGEYFGKVIYAAGVSALLAYMGTDLLEGIKKAVLKIISFLPEIAKSKLDKDADNKKLQ